MGSAWEAPPQGSKCESSGGVRGQFSATRQLRAELETFFGERPHQWIACLHRGGYGTASARLSGLLSRCTEAQYTAGTKKVFIAFHNPAFARSGMGAIPDDQNPHKTIGAYAKDLDIVVFNGHVHTTELYAVDGVKYLLLGGGGAEQDQSFLAGRISSCPRTIRPISIGRARLPRRNTTMSSWT